MAEKPEEELEVTEWELINNDEPPIVSATPEFSSPNSSSIIRSDHFSLNQNPNSVNSVSSSCSSNSEIDRNFDDSYVANQLFPNPIAPESSSNNNRWNDSDSDNSVISDDSDRFVADTVGLSGDSEEKVEEEVEEKVVKGENERLVWWKVPFEVLKHWVSPLLIPVPLSVAAAAAFLGLLILGRRLYKMKRKTQTLKLNLALDDKKVAQLMGRVARLNEAFSVVKRIPVVRPSLPAPAITLRPVMSMR
ncbi:uncharacterized protein LOC131593513 [Vicia villosa]|uniref:uncharacterized protein LOC131593513 n=1 Tax=Vicia villosa TaxID=3911 RepID=UPI00273C9365|nr:uncharacterized protein LOC131593513 [Vicia villosa]